MAPDVSGGLRKSPSYAKSWPHVLKKGPWSTSEDMLLLEYVKKHGEGNWNAVQRNSGLMRCGKSCRLRWANHLRPNLKKGAFTSEEEKLIVDLHAKLGNKWARMAAQLPGRTDNEIKNYWNTRLKRRQRAGLPIYPQQEQQQQQQKCSSQTSSLSSLVPSAHLNNPNPFTFSPSMISPPQNQPITPYMNHQLNFHRPNDGSLSLSLNNSDSLFSSSTFPASSLFNQRLVNQLPMTSLVQYNSLNYGTNTGPEISALGLPSIQPAMAGAVTPEASSSEFLMATTSSDGAEDCEVELGFGNCNKSGLLEDLFGESQALAHLEKPKEEPFIAASVHEEETPFGYGHGIANFGDNYEGMEGKASREGITAMDDDLMNLLDNFPLSVPIPDWSGGDGSESPMLTNGTSKAIESQPKASEYNPVATTTQAANEEWNYGSCLWNNMPSIY